MGGGWCGAHAVNFRRNRIAETMIDIFKHTKTIVRMLARARGRARALNQMSIFVYMYKIAKMQNKSEKQISTRREALQVRK